MILTGVKAILFDLDGTLIDTERYYRKLWPQTLEHFGKHMSDEQYLALRSLGRSFARERFREWFGSDLDYDAARAYRSKLFKERIEADGGIKAKEGASYTLSRLKEMGIICAIATATDEERTRDYLSQAGLDGFFDSICCASQVREGKPSPDLYLFACSKVGLSADDCIAVEDAPNGIRSAASAGLRVIFVPDQTKDEPEVSDLISYRIKSLPGLIDLLQDAPQKG